MRSALDSLLNLGIHESQAALLKKKIRTTNLLNALVIFFLLIGSSNYLFLEEKYAWAPSICFLVLSSISLWFNAKHHTNAASVLFTLNANAMVFYANQRFPLEAGSYLYYFPLIVTIVLLSNLQLRDRQNLVHVTVSLAFFLLNLVIDVPGIREQFDPDALRLIWIYNVAIASIITAVLSVLLSRLIHSQNEEIVRQNENLSKAQHAVSSTLREKEVLLAELHHRVKNNLAIISGLLNLQGDATTNDEARQIINDSKNRIMSMALVHRMLFENPNLKNIAVSRYTGELLEELFNTYNLKKTVTLKEDYDNIVLPVSKSIPLGLILNEIITNSIKYAFKASPGQKGTFEISIKKMPHNRILLTAKDSGQGFPSHFDIDAPSLSLGIFLIKTLSEQIDGSVRFSNENGARIDLDFIQQ